MAHQNLTDVVRRRNEALLKNDVEAFVALFEPDGVVEQPFALNGMPTRLEGREAIRAFSARTFPAIRFDSLEEIATYGTDDPEVVIVELATQATLTSSGQSFSGRSISVFRIRNGAIALFRTYAGSASGSAPPSNR
jgi:uncharacterized protein (TIGR02246 family)